MKASALKTYLQQLVNNVGIKEWEPVEEGLGFDAMLSHDVVTFLRTDHSVGKPLRQRGIFRQNAVFALDEHELAMV